LDNNSVSAVDANILDTYQKTFNMIDNSEKLNALLEIIKLEPLAVEPYRDIGIIYLLENNNTLADSYLSRAVELKNNANAVFLEVYYSGQTLSQSENFIDTTVARQTPQTDTFLNIDTETAPQKNQTDLAVNIQKENKEQAQKQSSNLELANNQPLSLNQENTKINISPSSVDQSIAPKQTATQTEMSQQKIEAAQPQQIHQPYPTPKKNNLPLKIETQKQFEFTEINDLQSVRSELISQLKDKYYTDNISKSKKEIDENSESVMEKSNDNLIVIESEPPVISEQNQPQPEKENFDNLKSNTKEPTKIPIISFFNQPQQQASNDNNNRLPENTIKNIDITPVENIIKQIEKEKASKSIIDNNNTANNQPQNLTITVENQNYSKRNQNNITNVPLPPLPDIENQNLYNKNIDYNNTFQTKKNLKNIYLDLNKATREDLLKIKELTELDIVAILEYRNNYGNFYNVSDLLKIPGLSSKYHLISEYFYINADNNPNNINANISSAQQLNISEKQMTQNVKIQETAQTNDNVYRLNINTASEIELSEGLGISRIEAKIIINYRERFGALKAKEEFKNIPLLGEKYELLKEKFDVK